MHSESTTFKAPRRSARVPPAYRPSAAYYAPVYTGPSRREICILTFACIAIMLATVIFMMVVFTRAGVLYVPEGSLLGSYRVFQTFPPPPLRALRHAPKVTEYIEMDPAKRTLPPIPGPPRNYSTPSGSAWDALPRIAIVTLNHQAPQKRVVRLNEQPASRQTYPRESANVWMHPMSYANKVAYCKKWGYDLIIEDSSLVDPQRDPAWGKIPILRKWLPKYQWIMWVDMDAFFMRFDLPATDLISDAHDMVIAKDWHGINFGIFLMRNSEWSLRLLDLMWYTPPRWWKPWEEQSAFTSLLNPLKTGVVAAAELERRVLIRGQREMNSYGAEFAYGNQAAQYRDGDRMVHFPNCKAIHSCRSTIVKFYRLMCARNGLPTSLPQPNETPAKVLPLNRSSSGDASHG